MQAVGVAGSARFPPLGPVCQGFRLQEGTLSAFLRASPTVSKQVTEFAGRSVWTAPQSPPRLQPVSSALAAAELLSGTLCYLLTVVLE